jgi:hypothetical protein
MGIKHDLRHSIYRVLQHNKLGSFATQADRKHLLRKFADDLVNLNYGLRDIHGLKEKHVRAVVAHWQQQKLTSGTIKNRLSALRCLASAINKTQVVPSNKILAIPPRIYVSSINKAKYDPDFSRISNPYVLISMQLQRVFGLRREESLKIKPILADHQTKLVLQPSWCKGGRGREIPIRTDEQRQWLDQAKAFLGDAELSLIPKGKNYIQHRYTYEKQAARAGLGRLHGLRHAYAQRRYKELTGWEAPINGGLGYKELTPAQRDIDKQARLVLTEELGHSRIQITVNYCGK